MPNSTPYPSEMRSYPRVDAVIDMVLDWLAHRRAVAETCRCDTQELDRMAHDLGVSAADLDDMVRRGTHASDELVRRMTALHLDPAAIGQAHGLVMRDMARVCAQCTHKPSCREDLVQGTVQADDEYCGNALTLRSLGAH